MSMVKTLKKGEDKGEYYKDIDRIIDVARSNSDNAETIMNLMSSALLTYYASNMNLSISADKHTEHFHSFMDQFKEDGTKMILEVLEIRRRRK